MATEQKFHLGIKALIERDGLILLMAEDVSQYSSFQKPYWDLPGGRVQTGESAIETLRREVDEETGITEINDPKFYTAVISNHQIKLSEEETVGLVLMVYKVTIPATATITLSDEHTGYEWCSYEEAAERLGDKYPEEFTKALGFRGDVGGEPGR